MIDSNENINEHVINTVRDIRTEYEVGERPVITEKIRKYRVNRFRIQRRLKNIKSRTSRKLKNYKLLEIQKQVLLRYILSLNEIEYSIRYNYVNKIVNEMFKKNFIEDDYVFTVDYN